MSESPEAKPQSDRERAFDAHSCAGAWHHWLWPHAFHQKITTHTLGNHLQVHPRLLRLKHVDLNDLWHAWCSRRECVCVTVLLLQQRLVQCSLGSDGWWSRICRLAVLAGTSTCCSHRCSWETQSNIIISVWKIQKQIKTQTIYLYCFFFRAAKFCELTSNSEKKMKSNY